MSLTTNQVELAKRLMESGASLIKEKHIYTAEEVQALIDHDRSVNFIVNVDTHYYFAVNDYCFGAGILSDSWVHCSIGFPQNVVPRPGLEDGYVNTFKKYQFIFHKDGVFLDNLDDVVSAELPE